MTTLFERSKCEVKFQSVRVINGKQKPSPLVERIADKVGFLARVISSLVDAQTEILLLGLLAPTLLGLAWLVLLRLARTVVWWRCLL